MINNKIQIKSNSFLSGISKTLDINGTYRPHRVIVRKNQNISTAWKNVGNMISQASTNMQSEIQLVK